MLWNWF